MFEGSGYLDYVVSTCPRRGRVCYGLLRRIERRYAGCVGRSSPLSVIDGDYYGSGRNYPLDGGKVRSLEIHLETDQGEPEGRGCSFIRKGPTDFDRSQPRCT